MKIKLRPYQTAAIRITLDAIDSGQTSGAWSMPTGCGKTVTFAALSGWLRRRTLILVHRDELVTQTLETVGMMFPSCPVGVVKAELNEWETNAAGEDPSLVVASIQSLHARRLLEIPPNRFGLIVADEAHHAAAPSWQAVLDHFQAGFTLGVSATLTRHDGKGLERFGREPIYSYPLRQAIEDRWLCGLRQYAVETRESLDSVGWRCGDFADGELSRAVNTERRNRCIVDAYRLNASGRRALAFCVDVAHAEDLASTFQDFAGIKAVAVSGSTPIQERREILRRFASEEIQVVTNCAVLTEGFDDPGIGAVLMARPTASRPLYTQCIGRGLRTAPGKSDCLILDFVDASQHKLVDVLDLMGATSIQDANGGDVLQVVDEDRRQAEVEARIASQRPLCWRLKAVCPWPDVPDLHGYTPRMTWETAPATKKQIRFLKAFGLDITRGITKGEASFLIHRSLELEAAHPIPPTRAQRWRLEQEGLWRDGLSKREAVRLLAGFFGAARCH